MAEENQTFTAFVVNECDEERGTRENRSETKYLHRAGDFAFHAAVAFSPRHARGTALETTRLNRRVFFSVPFHSVSTSFETEHVTVFAETTRSSPFGEE